MLPHLVEAGTTRDRRGEMDRIVHDQMLPALTQEPGYGSSVNLIHRATGSAMMLTPWHTHQQAELLGQA